MSAKDEDADTIVASVAPSTARGPAAETPAGALVGGRYRLLSLLGEGGMGTVFRVHDAELDEIVAMKVIHPHLASDPTLVDRFRQEVKLARRVTHPHVARVFDIGDAQGEKFFTMEYVEGEALVDLVSRDAPLPMVAAVELLCAIGRGLDAAHTAGVVHRDLKPENVLLGKDGRVLITDFGIARAFEGVGARHTMEGLTGTPAYMAPEQVEARPDVDGRADLYALGEIGYELFTGEHPWPGTSPLMIAAARLQKPPPDPAALRPTMPEALAAVVRKAMARDRDQRFATAAEMVAALELALSRISARATPTARPSRPPDPLARDARSLGVAVLPFRNEGPPEDDYLAKGIASELVDALSMTSRLQVRPFGMTCVFPRERIDGEPAAIGRELGVACVVTGGLQRSGQGIRLSARGISVAQGYQLWARRFQCTTGDLFSMSDEIAQAVAHALTAEMPAPPRASANGEAIELYLRGRAMVRDAWFSIDDLGAGLDILRRAHALAPEDPTIAAALASARVRRAFMPLKDTDIAQELREGKILAERVVAEAPHVGEAWLALAHVHWMTNDPISQLRALRGALDAAPFLARAHEMLGRMLLVLGKLEAASRRIRSAMAMDAASLEPRWELARIHAFARDWPACEALFSLPVSGAAAQTLHSMLSVRFELWRRGPGKFGPFVAPPLPDPPGTVPYQLRAMGLGALEGKLDEALLAGLEEFLALMPKASRTAVLLRQLASEWLIFLGENERALAWIGHAVDGGFDDLAWMERCPLLEPVRGTPAFATLAARVRERCAPVLALAHDLGLAD